MNAIAWVILFLIVLRWGTETILSRLNTDHVKRHAADIPEAFRDWHSPESYQKSVLYTLAKNRLGLYQDLFDTMVLLGLLFSGFLPWLYVTLLQEWGTSLWTRSLFLLLTGLFLSLAGLPWSWYTQFHLEQKFGFNTSTPRIWLTDQIKGFLLGIGIGYPVLLLLLAIAGWSGDLWWLWAWVFLVLLQLLFTCLVPVLILPLFYRLTPLPEGALRQRLSSLADRLGFRNSGLLVMDGSRRSRHSNAFFTGMGRSRKIVLFDTLVEKMPEEETEAVLAHEIGHSQKGHIRKMTFFSSLSMLIGFWVLNWLAGSDWLYQTFSFPQKDMAVAFLLFALLSGCVSFWISPFRNWFSRRFEYEADAFAGSHIADAGAMIRSLRRLNRENLSNLTPHPWYSFFYYSHPTPYEREKALQRK